MRYEIRRGEVQAGDLRIDLGREGLVVIGQRPAHLPQVLRGLHELIVHLVGLEVVPLHELVESVAGSTLPVGAVGDAIFCVLEPLDRDRDLVVALNEPGDL